MKLSITSNLVSKKSKDLHKLNRTRVSLIPRKAARPNSLYARSAISMGLVMTHRCAKNSKHSIYASRKIQILNT